MMTSSHDDCGPSDHPATPALPANPTQADLYRQAEDLKAEQDRIESERFEREETARKDRERSDFKGYPVGDLIETAATARSGMRRKDRALLIEARATNAAQSEKRKAETAAKNAIRDLETARKGWAADLESVRETESAKTATIQANAEKEISALRTEITRLDRRNEGLQGQIAHCERTMMEITVSAMKLGLDHRALHAEADRLHESVIDARGVAKGLEIALKHAIESDAPLETAKPEPTPDAPEPKAPSFDPESFASLKDLFPKL